MWEVDRITRRKRRSGELADRREPEAVNQDCQPLRDKEEPVPSRVPSDGAECVTLTELPAGIVLHGYGTIVIMKACKLSSRRRVATTACAVSPAPGIVG